MVILSSVIVTHIVFKRARAFAPFRFHDQLKTSASRLFSIFVHSVVSRKRTWNGLQEFRGRPKANTSLGIILPVSVPALMRRVESLNSGWELPERAPKRLRAASWARTRRKSDERELRKHLVVLAREQRYVNDYEYVNLPCTRSAASATKSPFLTQVSR